MIDISLGDLLNSAVFLSKSRQLPLLPTISIKGAIADKCKVMDSAKLPMWAVFEYPVITFKAFEKRKRRNKNTFVHRYGMNFNFEQ